MFYIKTCLVLASFCCDADLSEPLEPFADEVFVLPEFSPFPTGVVGFLFFLFNL